MPCVFFRGDRAMHPLIIPVLAGGSYLAYAGGLFHQQPEGFSDVGTPRVTVLQLAVAFGIGFVAFFLLKTLKGR
jgi:hypothetical protein